MLVFIIDIASMMEYYPYHKTTIKQFWLEVGYK